MRFSVCHVTHYRYSAPVRLGGHRLRLTPRSGGALLAHSLQIDPAPVARTTLIDAHGNPVTDLDFDGHTDQLRVEMRFVLQTVPAAPPPAAGLPRLPWLWPDDAPPPPPEALAALPATAIDPEVRAYAAALAQGARQDAPGFLTALNHDLFTRTDRQIRLHGRAQTPLETLTRATGACRDLAVLFIAAARSQGLPARFVSGYQARAESVDGQRHLHAWVEVWLPGHGWAGYDPTHGMAVSDGHVALSAAPDQDGTMPLEGGFWGEDIRTLLSYRIEIETDETEATGADAGQGRQLTAALANGSAPELAPELTPGSGQAPDAAAAPLAEPRLRG